MKLTLRPEAARARLSAGAAAGLGAAGNILLDKSRARVPVDTGRLRSSGYAESGSRSARVGYTAPYAAVVHEKQDKFLEAPANDPGVQAQILAALARHITF